MYKSQNNEIEERENNLFFMYFYRDSKLGENAFEQYK